MRTKTLFIYLLLLTFVNITAQEWKLQISPTSESLRDVFFIDKIKGWVVGDNGTVLRTIDGGNIWIKQEINTLASLRSIFFIDSLNGYSVGTKGRIIKSTDGGITWEIQASGTNLFLSNVFFINKEIGWIVGGASITGSILKTTNSGLTWEKMIDSTVGSWRGVHFIDENNGWIVGAGGFFDNLEPHRILRTTDGGITWQNLSDFTRPGPLVDVYFLNKKCGWASGYSPSGRGILYTDNGGLIWKDRRIQRGELSWSDYYHSLAVVDSNNIWVATEDTIYQTIDGGNTWRANSCESNNYIGSIYFADKNNGWAVGGGGSIWKYNGNIVSVQDEKSALNKNSVLENCFPNPFNPSTTIRYQIPQDGHISLKVYDMLGREVAQLVNEVKIAGEYTVSFDGSKLSSGVYIYKLVGNNINISKKMILMK